MLSRQPKKVKDLLRQVCIENGLPGAETMKLIELIKQGHGYFFDFEYPMIEFTNIGEDDFYPTIGGKDDFEIKFLMNFIDAYIGTYDDDEMFFLNLEECLNKLWPYYINILKSEEWFKLYVTNPADNTSYTETYTRQIDGNTSSDSSSESTSSSEDKNDSTSDIKTDNDLTITSEQENTSESNQTQSSTSETSQNVKNIQNDTPINMLDDTDYASSIGSNDSSVNQATNGSGNTTSSSTVNGTSSNVEHNKTNQIDVSKSTSSGKSTTKGITTGKSVQVESYQFNRTGNIGVQTPGEVFEHSRRAFLNTLLNFYNDKITQMLFLHYYGGVL